MKCLIKPPGGDFDGIFVVHATMEFADIDLDFSSISLPWKWANPQKEMA